MSEAEWRRVHPASLAVNLLPQAWRTARATWPVLLVLFLPGQSSNASQVADVVALSLFLALSVSTSVIHFFTLRYRFFEGRLEIKSGLLSRQRRNIDPARIQNLEIVQNLFHRASGLVELRIETAGGTSTEGLLSALSVAEARRLQAALDAGRGRAPELAHAPPPPPLLSQRPLELIAYGLSRRQLGTVALFTAAGMEILGQMNPADTAELSRAIAPGVLAGGFLLAFAASWLLSAGRALLRHYGFRLWRQPDAILTEEGLTTRRRVEIPLRKVQLVRSDEPLLRRSMGYATLLIETAGLGVEEGRVRQAEAVLPMVATEDLPAMLAAAVPGLGVDPWTARLLPPHRRALLRGCVRAVLKTAFLASIFAFLARPWGAVGALAFLAVPLAVPAAWLDWRRQGWLVTDAAVLTRRGYFTRRSWVIARDKIQSVHVQQSPLMRWNGLASVRVRVAGTEVALPDLGEGEAMAVFERLRGGEAAA